MTDKPSMLVALHQLVGQELSRDYQEDAYGRLRVSNPQTLFDSKMLFDDAPLFWDDQEVSGGSTTSAHSVNKAEVTIGVGTAAGKRVRQTFIRHNYQPGKSQLVLMSGNLKASGGGSGITANMGIFDADNGIFLQQKDGIANAVLRSKVTGSVVNTTVPQESWNIDKLDGTGRSGIRYNAQKSQLLLIDYEWLSVGRVRLALIVKGIPIYFHEFDNANVIAGAYMSTPNLPLRYSIENDGTGVASTVGQVCSTVISEGGRDPLGVLRWASTAGTPLVTDTDDLIFALIGIRLKSTHLKAGVKIENIALQIQTASEFLEWVLIMNPTVADTFAYSDQTNSSVQIATGATANTVTGGIQFAGGFNETGNNPTGGANLLSAIDNARTLGSAIDGTVDEIVLGIRPIAGSVALSVEGGIKWREIV